MPLLEKLPRLAAALALFAAPLSAAAQEEVSETVGLLPATIRAGTGATKAATVLSLPLNIASGQSWKSTGRISSLTTNTLVDSAQDWPAGLWSEPAAPWFIRITGGAAAGRGFLLSTTTPNTATAITLDASETVDLTTLGIATGAEGDTYEIFAAETLASLFPPEAGVRGGTGPTNSDTVEINRGGVWTVYYHDAASRTWKTSPGGADASHVVIPPDSAFLYGRLGDTPIDLLLAGAVQGAVRQAGVKNSGLTLLANAWPVSMTLADSGIQNLPGWVSHSAPANADKVQLHLDGVWQQFFHDGAHWRRIARGNPIKDAERIPAGSGVLINRLGAAPGSTVLQQSAPF